MSVRLPTELLRLIVEMSVSTVSDSHTYHERQRSLSALSLASRCLRKIAQPLLLETVWLANAVQLNSLLLNEPREGERYDGSHTRSVVLGSEEYDQGIDSVLDEVRMKHSEVFSSVTSLALRSHELGTVSLSHLDRFSSLSVISLVNVRCDDPGNICLPTVRSLSLRNVCRRTTEALLSRQAVLNVRALALQGLEISTRPQLNTLMQQLEVLTVSWEVWRRTQAECLAAASNRTLVDVELNDSTRTLCPSRNVRHVRIYTSAREGDRDVTRLRFVLDEFASSVRSSRYLILRSVYLDSSLQSDIVSDLSLHRVVDKLQKACCEREIDVVFEPALSRNWLDTPTSPAFVLRQRQSKRDVPGTTIL